MELPRRGLPGRLSAAVPLALVFAGCLAGQQATIREEKQSIKTYPFSGPNPSPTRSGSGTTGQRIYPYFSFDELSLTGASQTWNVVRMENPYIAAFVLPAEGGKLLGALEKSTNQAFVYYNHVLKFRNISMRGPWTSGGIELNFGIIGHAPSTASPVDYLVRKNSDGSVSCFVGGMDLPSRTEWRVEFKLPPDKAYLEARSLWYNPQPLNQSYYVWMNMAEKVGSDLELILPGTQWIGHNYALPSQPWPVGADGRDLSFYKNHDNTDDGSFFVHGALADFSGGYWHDSDFGYGHWALHEEVPGQKLFRWSLSRAGAIWENLLTDSDGQYLEHQTGRLLDQSDTGFFAPYSADRWREIYFPYKKIGPMVKATPYGALNVRKEGDALVLRFCALQKIDEKLVVRAAGKEIASGKIVLNPMEVFEKKIPASVKKGELRVEIGDKLSYTDDPNDGVLKRPLTFRNYDTNSLEGLYRSAERDNRERDYEGALKKYLACLDRDPSHVRALTRIAEIYGRRAEYAKGLGYARKALDYVMYDPDANFTYGILSRKMGDLTDAKETLGWAARSMQYRSSAYSELGGIYVMEGNLDRAQEYLARSLEYDANNVRTYQVLATVYRLQKQPRKAQEALAKILEIDPLNHLARFEQYLLAPGPGTLSTFKSMIRNELPHETYLEIAAYYSNLRLDADALRVLEVAPDQATIRYWQAYLLRDKFPAESRRALEKAAALSPYLVFPFREESIPVFQWAAAALPGDWKANYYLGLIYWGLRREQDAMKMFALCGDRPDYAPAYISRAFLEKSIDATTARADYEKALAIDRKDWRTWYHLADFYTETGVPGKALDLAVEASQRFPNEDAIKSLLARAYLENGRYQECNSALAGATILPFEGQRDIHTLFVQCLVSQAMADMKKGRYSEAAGELERSRDYPERLGTGAPPDPDLRIQDYLLMFCYQESGAAAKAAEAVRRIDAYAGHHSPGNLDAQKNQVGQWYRSTFRERTERDALQELSRLLNGGGRPGGE
jgi:tetratricopeptide (TPR) repeat protein